MERPSGLDARYVNWNAQLPYGVTVGHVAEATAETYRLFHGVNEYLVEDGLRPLEELLLGNSLSGIISEFLVKNMARVCPTLIANEKVGGHPDLLPAGHYTSSAILKGDQGIEVKASVQKGGWQGHNPEEGWVMVFRYQVGGVPTGGSSPMTFVEILSAKLAEDDWSFSDRRGASRRTPTASITSSGVEKLRAGFVYRVPGVGVGRHRDILADQA